MNSPIAYIVFNRPHQTEKTFSVLRDQRPSELFIIADGPRPAQPMDIERCAAVRAIVEQVDWPCEVHRNYADTNMGLKQRVSSGLDWVFEQVDRAIVLEDDCLPDHDFFGFCEALLERYEHDDRVAVITGNNFQDGRKRGEAAFYFSKYPHCWGWATWRRAWKHYQGDLPFWEEWRKSENWKQVMPDKCEREFWEKIFNNVCAGKIDSWAYPWMACVWKISSLTATPNTNLVSNIGFDDNATHTTESDSKLAKLPTSPLGELTYPTDVFIDKRADNYVFLQKILRKKRLFSWPMYRKLRQTSYYRIHDMMRRLKCRI